MAGTFLFCRGCLWRPFNIPLNQRFHIFAFYPEGRPKGAPTQCHIIICITHGRIISAPTSSIHTYPNNAQNNIDIPNNEML